MVTVMNSSKVLSVGGNFKVIGEIKNGQKKADIFRVFGLVNSASNNLKKIYIGAFEENRGISKA
jgi:hypothetical protein